MKKIMTITAALALTIAAGAQTLNIQVGSVTYQFPAAQCGEMSYSDGTTLTVMGKEFTLADITAMNVDDTEVTDNLVQIAYDGTAATVTVAGNVAQYVTPTVSDAHVTIAQSNTADVDDDEITYQLTGTTTDGSLSLSGSYKCTVSLAGVTLTNPSGAAINITNKKRIQISAKEGTENTLTDGADGSQKACIYSKGQIQLQGNGTLNVVGNTAHAIKSGDYISVKHLTLNITSTVSDGINCNAYFQMKSGTVTMTGIGDEGIQCDMDGDTATAASDDNHSDEDTGSIYIDGGTLTITGSATAAKCVKAEGDIAVSDGTVKLYANGAIDLTGTDDEGNLDPSYTAGFKADGGFTQSGGDVTISVTGGAGRGIACDGTFTTTEGSEGTLTITDSGATSSSSTYFYTAKGIKAGDIAIGGGTINVTTSGTASKAIKADSDDGGGSITITGGTVVAKCTGAGATDQTEKDGKGCSALNADGDITMDGGTVTLTSTGTGGKGLKADGTFTMNDGTLSATASGSNYSSGSYSASAKAIKAGVRTLISGKSASQHKKSNPAYTFTGGIVFAGGTVTAKASSHEAIESKSTITMTGGYVYAESSDDAINSASDFDVSGGYLMGYSTGNDGLDANGDFNISGGNVFAIGTSSPEVGIDANTEGSFELTITGGNVAAIAGLESGSTLSGVTAKQASSFTAGSTYALYSGSTFGMAFTIPSGVSSGSGQSGPGGGGMGGHGGGGMGGSLSLVVVTPSTPALYSATGSGTTFWSGYGYSTATKGSSVTLSTYSGGSQGGGPGGF